MPWTYSDETLSWDKHIENVSKKVSKGQRALKRIRPYVPQSEAKIIFLRNLRILLSISLLWLPGCFFFAEIPLTPASPPERNDGR